MGDIETTEMRGGRKQRKKGRKQEKIQNANPASDSASHTVKAEGTSCCSLVLNVSRTDCMALAASAPRAALVGSGILGAVFSMFDAIIGALGWLLGV